MPDLSLTSRRTINASAERIYTAWLDPGMMARFMVPRADMQVRDARCDPRVGGGFSLVMVGDKDYPHAGTFKELTPFTRLVFTWEAAWSAPDSTVEITLIPVANGTEVVLTHVKFTTEESRDNHERGWAGMLVNLHAVLT